MDEDFEKMIRDSAKKFFIKNMLGKDVDAVLYNVSRNVVAKLAVDITHFGILHLCLSAVRYDIAYYNTLNFDTTRDLIENINQEISRQHAVMQNERQSADEKQSQSISSLADSNSDSAERYWTYRKSLWQTQK